MLHLGLRLRRFLSIKSAHRLVLATNSSSSLAGNEKIIKSHAQLPVLETDVCSRLFPLFERWAAFDALICGETGQRVTFGELLQKSMRWGGALNRIVPSADSEGPKKALVFSRNNLEYPVFVYGTLAAGWTVVTMDSLFTAEESTYQLKDTKPDVIVVDSLLEDVAEEALRRSGQDVPIFTIGPSKKGRPNFQDVVSDSKHELPNIVESSPTNTGFILYSGGTTGRPKGVMISHQAMVNGAEALSHGDFYPFGSEQEFAQHNILCLFPLNHLYSLLVCLIITHKLGSKVVIMKGLESNSFGASIETNKINFIHLVPSILNFMASSPLVTKENMKYIKGAFVGSAPVMSSSSTALLEKVGRDLTIQEGYGLTEGLVSHLTPHSSRRLGFCGKLLPNNVAKVVDVDTNEPVEPGQRGELMIYSPQLMTGYLGNPRATAETFDEDGFLHTGDVATYTSDGYFSIVDRMKELIKVKAKQVSPAELEDSLMEHPAVAEAGVVGIPDERTGEKPKAFVVLKGKVTEEELKKHIEKRLSPHKWLTGGVQFVDQLPKSHVGKILRRKLLNK